MSNVTNDNLTFEGVFFTKWFHRLQYMGISLFNLNTQCQVLVVSKKRDYDTPEEEGDAEYTMIGLFTVRHLEDKDLSRTVIQIEVSK